ncbi:MAG: prepilin-type N-terminal cleavage/methylation domain-containing protein [Fimbriimonadaceae bacterium]|nr:prepilin-type N-terminal cleavage/methylation domain-containing protein [Fimbriimonadaceae bacterium]
MKKAFTLIELLVVIAIIAILAAILFPVFAQAKAAAKKSQDLSNVKQISLGITLYTTDHDDMYPSAYFHRAFNPALGGTTAGYEHWSGMVAPYVKNLQLYVSPGDRIQGHAPTCFTDFDNNSGAGIPSNQAPNRCTASRPDLVPANFIRGGFVVDNQVPRISYTVNSAVIGRYRNIGDVNRGISITSQTALDNVSGTILIAGFVDNVSCLSSASITSIVRSASHRSTNALSIDRGNTRAYFGSQEDGASRPAQIWALNFGQVTAPGNQIFQLCSTTPRTDYPLAVYHSVNRWNEGDNYGMADGSAKYMKFNQSINPTRYAWGASVLTDGGAQVLDPISGNPVTN